MGLGGEAEKKSGALRGKNVISGQVTSSLNLSFCKIGMFIPASHEV